MPTGALPRVLSHLRERAGSPSARIATCCAGILALLAPPVAAASWTAPASLSGRGGTPRMLDERAPYVAVNRRGEVVAAWAAKRDPGVILVARADASGRFGRPQRVGRGMLTSVGIADDGAALVAWWSDRSASVAVGLRNRRFGRAQTLARGPRFASAYLPRVVVGRQGDALVAWSVSSAARAPDRLRVAVRPRGGRFGAARTIGTGDGPVAFDERGHIVASLRVTSQSVGTFPALGTSMAQLVAGSLRGPFGAPVPLSSSPAYNVVMAIGAAGEIAVAWVQAQGPESDPFGPIQTAVGTATGRFEAPVDVPVARANRSFGPQVALGAAGEVVAVWRERLHPHHDGAAPVYWALRRPGTPFGPRLTLTAAEVTLPVLARTGDGRAVMVWSDGRLRSALYRSATGFRRRAAPRGRAQRFRPISLAASGDFAVVGWQDVDGRLRASVTKLPH